MCDSVNVASDAFTVFFSSLIMKTPGMMRTYFLLHLSFCISGGAHVLAVLVQMYRNIRNTD